MNIDIANKLYELRRQSGLSQEELAAKLGISRQAVSKWERAEASPDTDNLITLANLYGISLDELLLRSDKVESSPEPESAPDSSPDGASGEQACPDKERPAGSASVNFENGGIHISDADCGEVHVGSKGVFIHDGDESEVHVGPKGVFIHDGDEPEVHVGWDGVHVGWDGVHVGGERNSESRVRVDPNGTKHISKPGKRVRIDPDGTQHISKPGKRVRIDPDGSVHVTRTADANSWEAEYRFGSDNPKTGIWSALPWPLCALIAFLLIGFLVPGGAALPWGGVLPSGWSWGWLVLLTIPIYYSLFSAIRHRNPEIFCWPILVLLVYFAMGLFWGIWHPGWIIFLTIPIYYPLAYLAKIALHRKNPDVFEDDSAWEYYDKAQDEDDWDDDDDDEDEDGDDDDCDDGGDGEGE